MFPIRGGVNYKRFWRYLVSWRRKIVERGREDLIGLSITGLDGLVRESVRIVLFHLGGWIGLNLEGWIGHLGGLMIIQAGLDTLLKAHLFVGQ